MPPESSPSAVPVWLDLANERLWCGDQARVLRPKTFALLRYLAEHPGQLLTKAALLEALWPETTVIGATRGHPPRHECRGFHLCRALAH
jgi:DNA-binding response OmpR family regulator